MKSKINMEIICQNRKARYDYHILDAIETGIILTGSEIKSIRDRQISIDASYARITDGELWLIDCTIEPYKDAGLYRPDPKRDRKLLVHRKELRKLKAQIEEKGKTLIPLKVYLKNGLCKIELGVCQGKQLHDKRQAIKEREARREID
jgi:SsrA-binding protein